MFHFKEKLDSLTLSTDKITPPVHIRIKPTNTCNHNCLYCAYRSDNQQLGKDMIQRDYIPKEKMMEIVDDIAEIGVKAVTFSGGGDPFCYLYLLDTVKRLSRTKVKFACLTNGSKLNGELAEIFACHAAWLRISIDGWDDKSYSSYRRVPDGEFTKVINNIRNFKKLKGACFLGINIIVDKKNSAHIYDLIKILRGIGVNSVKVSPCIIDNDGIKNSMYHKPILKRVKVQTEKALREFSNESFEIFDSYYAQLETFNKAYTWCPYLQILPIIGADLNIYPCQDKAYNLNEGLIGSIKEKRFKDFWFRDKTKFFKINPAHNCNHHCVADAKNRLILDYLDADKEHLEFV